MGQCVDKDELDRQRFGRRAVDDADKRKIVDEAIGERPASAIPAVARDRVPQAALRPSFSVGPEASIAAKTAEAVGERVGSGAYADPATDRVPDRSWFPVRHRTIEMAPRVGAQSYVVAAAMFALGYGAAWLIHGRQ
jgi:hypothetical protein